MSPDEARDIFQRVRVVITYIDDQVVSYEKTVALRALREVAAACQEAMIERSDDTNRHHTNKPTEKVDFLAG